MTLVLQNELRRVGCDPGKVDGQWGKQGSEALTRFNRYAKLSLLTAAPSMEALEAIKRHEDRVCPLVCGPQYRVQGDDCVLKTCAAGQQLNSRGQCIRVAVKKPVTTSNPSPRQKAPKKSAWEDCIEKFGYAICGPQSSSRR